MRVKREIETKTEIDCIPKYQMVLMEKPGVDGLTPSEILSLLNKTDNTDNVYPIELQAYSHECSAMGFITAVAADKIDYDYELSGLHSFIANILDDMENESEDHTYQYKGISIYLSRY